MKDIPIAFIDDETLYESENYVNFKLEEKDKEIERLKSIIKEAREYTTTIKDEDIQYTIGWVKQDILQILDKVEENK